MICGNSDPVRDPWTGGISVQVLPVLLHDPAGDERVSLRTSPIVRIGHDPAGDERISLRTSPIVRIGHDPARVEVI